MPRPITQEQFLKASAPIRLDAFENYIRGLLATEHQQKVRYFRTALKLNPNYTLAMLQLGKTYYDSHEYESAASWFSRVPKEDPAAGEANFLLGMSEFYRRQLRQSACRLQLSRNPPAADRGLQQSWRGRGAARTARLAAVEYFSKAVNADPNDADYRFNLAVALYQERRWRRRQPATARRIAAHVPPMAKPGRCSTPSIVACCALRRRIHLRPRATRFLPRTSRVYLWSVSSATTTRPPISSSRWRSTTSPKRG